MRTAERVLIGSSGILFLAAIALSWFNVMAPQNFSSGSSADAVPWPLIWAQVASSVASAFALVAGASAAGLLFLRASRWTGSAAQVQESTPEP